MKKTAMLLAVATALTLGGCAAVDTSTGTETQTGSEPRQSSENPYYSERHIELEDGRTVVCLTYKYGGGLSCDWAGAK